LHPIERAAKVTSSYGLYDCATFVADDIREITALEREEQSATIWIAKI
jgi:hypothetical protein